MRRRGGVAGEDICSKRHNRGLESVQEVWGRDGAVGGAHGMEVLKVR